jgi:cell wall-associated NlpC family hydrolase
LHAAQRLLRTLLIGFAAVAIVAPATAAYAAPPPASLQQQIDKASADLEKIVEQYNKVNEQLKATKAEADQLQAQVGPLLDSLERASATVNQIAASAYKGGGVSTVTALLSSGSPTTFMEELSSLNQIARSQQKQIDGYTQTKAQYDARKKQLDDLLAQETAQQKDLAAQKTKIEADLKNLYDLRTQAYGSATNTSTSTAPKPPAPYAPGAAGVAVKFAYNILGAPYVWAGEGPGYDCSGVTKMAWRAAGVELPHNVAMQWSSPHVSHISRSMLQLGDLVFYSGLGHVAIYVGNNQVIHAPTFGEVVKIASIDMMTPYGYGRPHN